MRLIEFRSGLEENTRVYVNPAAVTYVEPKMVHPRDGHRHEGAAIHFIGGQDALVVQGPIDQVVARIANPE